MKEECTLEACIQLPPEYPLRNVEVTCTKRMGVSESRWRHPSADETIVVMIRRASASKAVVVLGSTRARHLGPVVAKEATRVHTMARNTTYQNRNRNWRR